MFNFLQAAVSNLKQEYKEGETTLKDAMALAIKVLSKTLDMTKLTAEKGISHQNILFFSLQAFNIDSLYVILKVIILNKRQGEKNAVPVEKGQIHHRA